MSEEVERFLQAAASLVSKGNSGRAASEKEWEGCGLAQMGHSIRCL